MMSLPTVLARVDEATPEGTVVLVLRDNGDLLVTKTRSAAWRTGAGDLIVSVVGISGGYAAWRCHIWMGPT